MGFFVNVVPTVIPQAFELSFESYIGRVSKADSRPVAPGRPVGALAPGARVRSVCRGAPVYTRACSRSRTCACGPPLGPAAALVAAGHAEGLAGPNWACGSRSGIPGLAGGFTYDTALFDAATDRMLFDRLHGWRCAPWRPGQSLRQLIESPGSGPRRPVDLAAPREHRPWRSERRRRRRSSRRRALVPAPRRRRACSSPSWRCCGPNCWASGVGHRRRGQLFDLGGEARCWRCASSTVPNAVGVRIAPQRVVAGTLRQVAERAEAVEALASADEAKEQAQSRGVRTPVPSWRALTGVMRER